MMELTKRRERAGMDVSPFITGSGFGAFRLSHKIPLPSGQRMPKTTHDLWGRWVAKERGKDDE